MIGDSFGEFGPNDIFVLGNHLPHVFQSDPSMKEVHMVSVFFTKNSFGTSFFDLEELQSLSQFFGDIALGYKVRKPEKSLLHQFSLMKKQDKYSQLITLLTILKALAEEEKVVLSSSVQSKNYEGEEGKRIGDIFSFTLQNYYREISLQEVARIANMTPTSFCRFFKQRTNKSYMHFLTELRLGQVCQLLTKNENLSIAEIAYRSGFNNLTHFNRQFKLYKGLTPSNFKKLIIR
ncbi:MAG: helix-turn-helix transcriptional regulator [Flavobacteriaceae bacterium]|nr:helix-turn-helix transcriptional regulator [Flavobacteriaceae bacterium]